jgi:hypothetical protein
MSQLRVFGAQPAYRRGDEVANLFAQATAHHRAGQLAKAQAGYKKVQQGQSGGATQHKALEPA